MDQHPIPQDVTGFQFKLIGNMTVKQFAYIAVGVVTAVVLYYLPLNTAWWIIFKVFFIPISGATGVIIAFVPIEGRPIDVMAGNFSKAIFAPNQYVYHKVGRKFSFSSISYAKVSTPESETKAKKPVVSQAQKMENIKQKQLQALLFNNQSRPQTTLDKKEMAFIHNFAPPPPVVTPATTTKAVHPLLQQKPMPTPLPKIAPMKAPTAPPPAIDQPSAQTSTDALTKQEATLVQQLQTAQKEEQTTHLPAVHQKVVSLEQQVANIHAQKQKLEQELAQLKNQLAIQQGKPPVPVQVATPPLAVPTATVVQQPAQVVQTAAAPAPITAPGQPQVVRNVPPAQTKKADLPRVSDTPNVVVGIVKDSRGNVLPNILVEVKDKDGNPVRAFKTNPLGQFASATPLNPGTYTIELEDPKKQHSFDVLQIITNNQILMPIEVISHDARETLRQQLFT